MKQVEIKCKGSSELPLSQITEFQGELKSLSKEKYDALKNEILSMGFSFPFAVWKNKNKHTLLDGHQRLRTLTQMKDEGYALPEKFPIFEIEADNEKQAAEKLLSFVSQYGQLESQGVHEFLVTHKIDPRDLITRFNLPNFNPPKFIQEHFDTEDTSEEDDAIPEVKDPIAKTGDLWLLGNHRLLVGDCTVKENVERLMSGEKADMVYTDPPYGIDFDPVNIGGKGQKSPMKIQGDSNTDIAREAFKIWKADIAIWWGGNYFTDFLPVNGAWVVWNKMKFDKPEQPFSHCELAWTNFNGDAVKMFSHVWDGCFRSGSKKDEAQSRLHPNQKPVGLTCDLLSGEIVADPFLGSGSTLIACEKTNRKCYGMEIDPHYSTVIIERFIKFVGSDSNVLLQTDNGTRSWAEVREERQNTLKTRETA